jgi:hypothetical protein
MMLSHDSILDLKLVVCDIPVTTRGDGTTCESIYRYTYGKDIPFAKGLLPEPFWVSLNDGSITLSEDPLPDYTVFEDIPSYDN